MARSQLATSTYNTLYSGVRSFASQRGMSGSVKVFFDGYAIINVNVSASNASVQVSTICHPVLDKNGVVIKWIASNEDETREFQDLSGVLGFCRRMVNDTRVILSKI